MFSIVLMLMSGLVSLGSVYFAFREQARMGREVAMLRGGIDQFTEESPSSALCGDELSLLLQDVFQEEHRATMVLALNELASEALLARERSRALARGMSRIPFLAGGAGALAVVALGRLESSSLILAGVCLGTGVVSSLTAQFLATRARRFARIWTDVVETLTRSVERRWQQAQSTGSGSSECLGQAQ